MANFLRHIPCPQCNSRDNLAIYSDGSGWCFGCHYKLKANKSDYVVTPKKERLLPNDLVQDYPLPVLQWITKYGISVEELIQRHGYYSKSFRTLFFIFDRGDIQHSTTSTGFHFGGYEGRFKSNEEEIYACGRNFSSSAKSKYTNIGSKSEIWCGYETKHENNLRVRRRGTTILVEDCLSAIKIARQCDSYPLMTSTLSLKEIKRLAGRYTTFLVWLDGNKYDNAQGVARRLSFLGGKAKAIYTPLDPKEYSDEEITAILDKGNENSV